MFYFLVLALYGTSLINDDTDESVNIIAQSNGITVATLSTNRASAIGTPRNVLGVNDVEQRGCLMNHVRLI